MKDYEIYWNENNKIELESDGELIELNDTIFDEEFIDCSLEEMAEAKVENDNMEQELLYLIHDAKELCKEIEREDK